jgi:hypothetical protein
VYSLTHHLTSTNDCHLEHNVSALIALAARGLLQVESTEQRG